MGLRPNYQSGLFTSIFLNLSELYSKPWLIFQIMKVTETRRVLCGNNGNDFLLMMRRREQEEEQEVVPGGLSKDQGSIFLDVI